MTTGVSGVSGAASADIVQLLMMRKALGAEKTHNEQLLASLPQTTSDPVRPPSPPPAGTFYL